MRRSAIALIAFAITFVWPEDVLSQGTATPPPSRVEIWGGWVRAMPTSGGLLRVNYKPALRVGGTLLDSNGTQELVVDTGGGHGIDVGVSVFGTQPLEMPGTRWHILAGAKVFVK